MTSDGTIAAISTAAAPAARIIVRMSGGDADVIAAGVADALPPAGEARQARLRFAGLSVPGWVYRFAAGRSYTSEASVEFHLPGNPVLARLLLDHLITAGARHPEPGEFTARAYFSGRLDLAEAEGVAATISAHSEQELRAARQLLAGELSRRLRPMMDLLAETLALLEAGIDFSDEDVTFLSPDQVIARLDWIDENLGTLVRQSARFERLAHEPAFVLVGRPNAGKSTLLNALAGHERAVVSPVAGTTRDALSAQVRLRRGMIRLIDVAGLEDAPEIRRAPTGGGGGGAIAEIERRMGEQARLALESADRVLLVREIADASTPIDLPRAPDLIIRTKCDLAEPADSSAAAPEHLTLSAVTGEGIAALRDHLDRLAFGDAAASTGSALALNGRHLRSIADARAALARGRSIAASAGVELIALELREALDALGAVLGQVTPDDVLGRVFATFCIGK